MIVVDYLFYILKQGQFIIVKEERSLQAKAKQKLQTKTNRLNHKVRAGAAWVLWYTSKVSWRFSVVTAAMLAEEVLSGSVWGIIDFESAATSPKPSDPSRQAI